jgi:hypothetical protein
MRALFTALSFLIVLAGCSQEALSKKLSSPEDEAKAKQYIDHLRNEQFDAIEKDFDPSLRDSKLHDVLVRMAELLPDREPDSVELVSSHTLHGPNGVTRNLALEYGFSGTWFLINVATHEKAGRATIVGFNVYPQPASQAEQHRFGLQGKTVLQYLVLALVVVLPLFTLYTLVVCVRTKLSGRKWPWVLFILVGITKLEVNWTTGAWDFAPLSLQVLSASAFAPLHGAWILAASLPVGALIFLLQRRSLAATP